MNNNFKIPTNIDWQMLVIKYKKKKSTYVAISMDCGMNVSSVAMLMQTTPKGLGFVNGVKLLNGFLKHFSVEEVPLKKQKCDKSHLQGE